MAKGGANKAYLIKRIEELTMAVVNHRRDEERSPETTALWEKAKLIHKKAEAKIKKESAAYGAIMGQGLVVSTANWADEKAPFQQAKKRARKAHEDKRAALRNLRNEYMDLIALSGAESDLVKLFSEFKAKLEKLGGPMGLEG